jgi:hypothetical protein
MIILRQQFVLQEIVSRILVCSGFPNCRDSFVINFFFSLLDFFTYLLSRTLLSLTLSYNKL